MKKLFFAALACLMLGSTANAATTTLLFGGGGGLLGTDSIIVNTGPLMENGVTFVAQFQVASTGGDLQQAGSGLGVGSNPINPGETITVSFIGFSSEMNGTAAFTGFNSLQLAANSDVPGEQALYTIGGLPNIVVTNGPHPIVGAPNAADITLTGIANPGNPALDSNFRLNSLDVEFSATATSVPEPSAFAAMCLMGLGVVGRRRRRS